MHGAVRSGKTYISIFLLLVITALQSKEHVAAYLNEKDTITKPRPRVAMVAQTRATFEQNILDVIKNIMGEEHVDTTGFMQSNTIHVMGIPFTFISGRESDLIKRIKGGTFSILYIDELTLISEQSFNNICTRAIKKHVQIISTTNPEHPAHYVKKNLIDQEKNSGTNLKTFLFTFDDNPSITEEEKRSAEELFWQPHLRDRYIYGKWVAAEGAIYGIDHATHIISHLPFEPVQYLLGVDTGSSNPFACTLIACSGSSELPVMVISEEMYHDGRRATKPLSHSEYLNIIDTRFELKKPMMEVYIDPSASALAIEMRNKGYKVMQTNNDVIAGIQTVSNFLHNGEICILDSCAKTIEEFYSYCWDTAASRRAGTDKVLKENDHIMDAIRYCLHTKYGHSLAYRKARLRGLEKRESRDSPSYHRKAIENMIKLRGRGRPRLSSKYTPIR